MKELMEEYGSFIIGVLAGTAVFVGIVTLFFNGGAVGKYLSDVMNLAF